MTLGRTSSGAIKLKTDEAGGGLRAVECACCGGNVCGCISVDVSGSVLNAILTSSTATCNGVEPVYFEISPYDPNGYNGFAGVWAIPYGGDEEYIWVDAWMDGDTSIGCFYMYADNGYSDLLSGSSREECCNFADYPDVPCIPSSFSIQNRAYDARFRKKESGPSIGSISFIFS